MAYLTWVYTFFLTEYNESIPWITEGENNEKVKARIQQKERCPETGRIHLQGMVRFSRTVRLKQAKEWLTGDPNSTIHLERCMDVEKSKMYCRKQETREPGMVIDFGFKEGGAKRSDLLAIAAAIQGGSTISQIAIEWPSQFIRYHRGLRELYALSAPAVAMKRNVTIFYGEPGSGKTYDVLTKHGDVYIVNTPGNDKALWFDGYEGQETILFDDFYGWIKWTFFLRICDDYALNLPIKGGYKPCMAKNICFTSNIHPRQWYRYDNVKREDAAIRRVNCLMQYHNRHFRSELTWNPISQIDHGGHTFISTSSNYSTTGGIEEVSTIDNCDL